MSRRRAGSGASWYLLKVRLGLLPRVLMGVAMFAVGCSSDHDTPASPDASSGNGGSATGGSAQGGASGGGSASTGGKPATGGTSPTSGGGGNVGTGGALPGSGGLPATTPLDAGPDGPSVAPLPESALVYAGGVDGSQGVIVLYRLDYATGKLTQITRVTAGKSAGFLAFDVPHHALYDADDSAMRVRRFALDPTTGVPGSPSDIAAAGNPVHVSRTADGKFVLTAAYNEGKVEAFSVNGNVLGASLGAISAGTWSHAIVLSPDERFAFVPCKGVDRIERYAFDNTTGHLQTPPVNTATRAGDGPRHFAFHPGGAYAYVVNELGNSVYAYGYAAATGVLTELQRITTLPDGFTGASTGAEVFVTASGKYVYASNRIAGQNGSVAMFRVGSDGKLTSMGQRTTAGHTPRSFAIDPTDRVVIAANQESNTLAVLAIDEATGTLSEPTGTAVTDTGMSPSYVGIVLRP